MTKHKILVYDDFPPNGKFEDGLIRILNKKDIVIDYVDNLVDLEKALTESWDYIFVNFQTVEVYDTKESRIKDLIRKIKFHRRKPFRFFSIATIPSIKEYLEKMESNITRKDWDMCNVSELMTKEIIMIKVNISGIKEVVCDYINDQDPDLIIKLSEKTRKPEIVRPRFLSMYFSVMFVDKSLKVIGKSFNRDHTSVIHACSSIKDLMDTDKNIKKEVAELKDIIQKKFNCEPLPERRKGSGKKRRS